MFRSSALVVVIVGALAALAGCAASSSGGASSGGISTSRPVAASWRARPEGAIWTEVAGRAIEQTAPRLLLETPEDIDAFCPGFRTTDANGRRNFYVALLSELARNETQFDAGSRATTPAVDGGAGASVSRGLFQISLEEASVHRCGVNDATQLFDATVNIQCAVRMMAAGVARDGVIAGWRQSAWRGASRYWPSLRNREKLADMQSSLSALPECRRR